VPLARLADLNSLMVFARVVEAKSFSEASRQLGMPLASVSRRVAELETRLGVRLLERSTRRLRLTDIGLAVFEHAHRTLEVREAVESIISDHQSQVAGVVRLSAPLGVSESLLSPAISAFRAKYPQVRVQVLITDRDVDPLSDGVDLMIRAGLIKDCTMISRRILTYRRCLVASPGYLKSHNPLRVPQDLSSHPMITFADSKGETMWTMMRKEDHAKTAVTFTPHLCMNDFAGLIPALLAGEGVGDLPPFVRADLLRDGRLVEVLPAWQFAQSILSIVHAGHRLLPRAVRLFKEHIGAFAAKLYPELQAVYLSAEGAARSQAFGGSDWNKHGGRVPVRGLPAPEESAAVGLG
jgi:DNA-binding transcriptional LysR family regulator